jgi:hypothetical protein
MRRMGVRCGWRAMKDNTVVNRLKRQLKLKEAREKARELFKLARGTVRPKLSTELAGLALMFRDRPVRVRELVETTRDRGYDLLLIMLVLPFLTPISLPFISTPFGLSVTVIGLRMALGQKPRLPQRLLDKELPPRFFPKLLRAASRLLRAMEHFLKPRLAFMRETFIFQRLTGFLIAVSGFYLLLSLPIPFTNFLPAVTILLLAAGALERDGVFLIGGWLMFGLSSLYFALIAIGGRQAVEMIRNYLVGG